MNNVNTVYSLDGKGAIHGDVTSWAWARAERKHPTQVCTNSTKRPI